MYDRHAMLLFHVFASNQGAFKQVFSKWWKALITERGHIDTSLLSRQTPAH